MEIFSDLDPDPHYNRCGSETLCVGSVLRQFHSFQFVEYIYVDPDGLDPDWICPLDPY
jgi:hypothetical protein